ncbi:MAG: ABC transporter permease [Candidatus Hodarchaeales archaeon]
MLKLALRNISRSKWRSILITFGIMLTIALETGIVVTVETIYDDFLFDNRNQNYTDITVRPREWLDLEDLNNLTKTVEKINGVKSASPVYSASLGFFGYKIHLFGVNSKSHPDFSQLNITEGFRKLANHTVIISNSLKEKLALSLGERITIPQTPLMGLNEFNLTIGGIFSEPNFFANREGIEMVLIDINTLYTLFAKPNEVLNSEIDITIQDLLKIRETVNEIKDTLGIKYFVFAEKNISDIQALGISAYSVAMNLVILSSILVEFLFTTNLLIISVRERQKEYGILRTIGTSVFQLLQTLFYEILIYSIIGSILGIILGLGFSNLLVGLLDQYYTNVSFKSMPINPTSLVIIFLSGIMVALISGLYPLFLAIKVPIIQNIHTRLTHMTAVKLSRHWRYLLVIGIVLAITGFSLSFFVGPGQALEFSLFSGHFFVIILIFLGTLLTEAGILVFLPSIGEKSFIIYNQAIRTISMRNISREFQRSLFTIMTSSVALTFVIFVGIVSASVTASVPTYYENQWGTVDMVVEAKDNYLLPVNFSEILKNNENIKQSAFIMESRVQLESLNSYIFGVEPEQYRVFAETIYQSLQERPTADLLNENTTGKINIAISAGLLQSLSSELGSTLTLHISSNRTEEVVIASIIKGNTFLGDGKYFYVNSKYFERMINLSLAKWFVCDISEGKSIYKTQENISETYPFLEEVIGIDFYRRVIENSLIFQSNLFQILFIESFVLSSLAQFVTMLIATMQLEREMGIMRSFGLSKKGVLSVFVAESTTLGLTAIAFGIFDGFFASILLLWYISFSIPLKFVLPINHILFWLIIFFIVNITSTFIPAYTSSRKEVISTISARPMRKTIKTKPKKKKKAIKEMEKEDYLYPKYIRYFLKIAIVIYYIMVLVVAYFILFISIY